MKIRNTVKSWIATWWTVEVMMIGLNFSNFNENHFFFSQLKSVDFSRVYSFSFGVWFVAIFFLFSFFYCFFFTSSISILFECRRILLCFVSIDSNSIKGISNKHSFIVFYRSSILIPFIPQLILLSSHFYRFFFLSNAFSLS